MYKVLFTEEAEAFLLRQIPKIRRQLFGKIEALAAQPFPPGCKRLQATCGDLYRIRSGDYRIIYQVHQNRLLVLVVRVGTRQEVYRRLPSKSSGLGHR